MRCSRWWRVISGMLRCAVTGGAYLLGLLSHTERKNSWSLAEFAGEVSPDGLQRLLNFSPWDEDGCRDAERLYVVRHLGDPAAVLAVDETGFLKKGRMSAGAARMYTGTAGRVENCQVGVFLAYVTPGGSRALTDRELYLPEKWTGDRERCRAAGIGDEVAFATKPELARQMIERAVQAQVPFGWVAGNEVYGGNPKLREWLEQEKIPYVLAVGTSPCPCSRTPSSPSPPARSGRPLRRTRSPLARTLVATPVKRGSDSCGQIFAPPRTYAPPAFMTDETGRELIPLTAAETRRLFNLHTRVTRPAAFHKHWSD